MLGYIYHKRYFNKSYYLKESEMETSIKYEYSNQFTLATQLKSWMALNPNFGCIWDCAYCIQHKDEFFNSSNYLKINKMFDPEEVVSEIMANPRITSRTPLALYNFSDPFLPQNTTGLKKILYELDKRKFTNLVGLITRTFVDDDTLDTIANLTNIKPIIIVSYAGYENRKIEGGPLKKRVQLMKEIKKRKISLLQYLRPIAREWLEPDQFKKTRDAVAGYIDGVVMSGVRLTPEVIKRIEKKGLTVPYVPNYLNKFFPKEIQEEILEVYKDIVPVYRYTSCGISSTLRIPDYNAHLNFLEETQNKEFNECPLPCRSSQSGICKSRCKVDEKIMHNLLDRIGHDDINFEIKKSGLIYLAKEVSKQDLSFLRHNTSSHVDYIGNKHHIDQIANMGVKSQK